MSEINELDAKWLELVEAGRAEWSPGMLDTDGGRVVDPGRLMTAQKKSVPPPVWQLLCGPLALPDFTDPATLGALLGQVCEAWGEEMLLCMDSKGDWGVMRAIPGYVPVIPEIHRTKAGALLAALEAAP